MTINVKPQVAAGAALLDEKGPEGWAKMIDRKRLNVSHADNCPLGQVYGYYADGADMLGLPNREIQERHGFNVATYNNRGRRRSDKVIAARFRALTRVWDAEIEGRQAAAA